MSVVRRGARAALDSLAHSEYADAIRLAVLGAAVTVILTLLWPARYTSTAVLLLDSPGGLSSALEAGGIGDLFPIAALGIGADKENGYAYLQVCKSRSVCVRILGMNDDSRPLHTYFERFAPKFGKQDERIEDALRKLQKAISPAYDPKSNMFRIVVRTRDPKVSAAIANVIVQELKHFDADVRTTRARDAAEFVQARVEEARASLSQSEARLASFQEANARIGNAPNLLLQMKRLERDVRLNEEIFALLSRQLEMARIQQKKDAPVFSIVDGAVRPARPERTSLIVTGLFGGVFCGVAALLIRMAFFSDRRRRVPA